MAEHEWGLDEYGRPALLGAVRAEAVVGPIIPPMPDGHEARSPHWAPFLHGLLLKHPYCVGCGRKAATGHHEVPFHIDRSKELLESNILIVCLPCHFVLCHGGDWRLYIETVRVRLAANQKDVQKAQAERAPGSGS